jgi:archaeosine synthase
VDLVDTTEGLWEAGPDELLDAALGRVPTASSRAEEMCRCPGCSAGGTDAPVRHALEAYADEMARVRSCMRSGRLRELVELRLTAEPALAEMLRYADRWLAERLEERTPVVGQATRGYVLRESFRRPEVARYRQRLRERYRPPPSKEVLLLLPCSKTKPYRNSRSHRRFIGAIGTPPRLERLQVASVTSPLGVVPRELEDLYPARHYDIPVTGEWDEAERAAVREGVAHLLHSGTYRSVVVHLDPAEYDFLRDLLPATWPAVWTLSDDRTASPAALRSLHDSVGEMLERLEPVEGGPLAVVKEELAALAAFQFGRRAAERLFQPPVRLKGRPWFQHLFDGEGVELATWQETRGLFHLTVAGGRRMMPDPALAVTIDPAVPLSGDLFTPGVLRADPAIRVGDAVLVVRAGELAAVGEAELPGPLMTQLPRGKAVTVRHRVHAPAGERPTPT